MSIPDGSPPDLIFYYSVDPNISVITKNVLNTTILQTYNGPIFADEALAEKIGKWAIPSFTNTIKNSNNGLYDSTGTSVYFLPNGTLSMFNNVQRIKNSEGNYVNPSGVLVLQIVGGTEDFLNATGYIVQIINNKTLSRKILVYFNK
jgi:hypothetical protein